jgi:TRAP-type mannitol/chloroaromatic compound transport system permease large subunit
MAPIIFVSMVIFLLVGFPVAFALAANGIFFGLIGIELGLLGPQLFQALPDRIFGVMSQRHAAGVPFFTFMGLILERSGMAEDLLDTIGQLFGPIRGGLAFAVIFVGALLAATTGVVAASVISMGLISLPIMLRYGYDKARDRRHRRLRHAGADHPAIAGPDHHGRPARQVGRRHVRRRLHARHGADRLYVGYVVLVAIFKPNWAPALPPEARTLRGSKLLLRVLTTLVPPLLLIFLVLGTIFLGIATPTEGGAMGATGALIMALARGGCRSSCSSRRWTPPPS